MPKYPYEEGDVTVIGPECFTDGQIISYQGENYISQGKYTEAIGYISAVLAGVSRSLGRKSSVLVP